ncbi:MAG: bifunctional diguanylate cyclase/phosphodiesterase [Eubacteriales bacterium]|nr:bifunctional diguanylate cyclase/phosphodiesterase [Eubacteriales bacterium]
MNKRRLESFVQVISVVLFVGLVGLIAYCSRHYMVLYIMGNPLEIGRLLSLLTMVQMLVTMFLTIYGGKHGYHISVTLLAMHMGVVIAGMIQSGSLGSIPGIFMNFEAILILTVINSYIKKMNKIVYRDTLTNLYNRRALISEVEQLIDRNKRFAFVLIDLDDFKKTNDLMGHDRGDILLQKFSEKWSRKLQNQNVLFARLGGDEFVIIMETELSKEEFRDYVKNNVLQEIYSEDHKYVIGSEEISVSASIGVAVYPDDAENYTDLYRYADVAMYYVKNRGKQNVEIFQSSYMHSLSGDFMVEQNIRNALQKGNFYVVYQPQFSAETEKLIGAEALARIKDSEGNTISPYYFIPVAEETRIIVDLDFYIFGSALKEFRPLLDQDPNLTLSVNFSVKTIFSVNFTEKLNDLLKKYDFPVQNLMIEITESVLISPRGREKAVNMLQMLKEMGIRTALDDFGTGYSSLSYLMELPIDTLKIDKSFVDKLSDEQEKNAYIEAVISMGHILHHNVIAEGVETAEQLHILKKYECDQIQGYLLGKPVRMEKFQSLTDLAYKRRTVEE